MDDRRTWLTKLAIALSTGAAGAGLGLSSAGWRSTKPQSETRISTAKLKEQPLQIPCNRAFAELLICPL